MAYESKFKRDDIDELFKAVLLLEYEEDCYRFFEDICTINEIYSIAQRLRVAKLLSEKKTYMEIAQETNASMEELNATFTLISQSAMDLQDLANKLNDTISYFKI